MLPQALIECSRLVVRLPTELRIAQRVVERTLEGVGARARGRCNLATGELTPRNVVGARDDTRRPNRFLWDCLGPECQPVERDLILVWPLSGDGEPAGCGIRPR